MRIWRVWGGAPLTGSLRVQGAKNSVLPIMAASILAPCETELMNCPDLSDVRASIRILRHLGCTVVRDGDTIYIDSRGMYRSYIPHYLMREMRSSVTFLGAILGRCGQAIMSQPGGCELGPRPIDLHLEALHTLGADVEEFGGSVVCSAPDGLKGGRIHLRFPSVGATENAMLAACAARGETIITNAAREPEIEDLQNYLRQLGADIEGAGEPTIHIRGFQPVRCVGHRIMSDRIEAATMLSAVAAAGGDIELLSVENAHIRVVLSALQAMGCEVHEKFGSIRLLSNGCLRAAPPIETSPHPGFPTDAQPILMAACLRANGTSVFVENIFSNRFRHAEEMCRLGAQIRMEGRVAVVTGVPELIGAPVTATDLRGGAALVLAGLCARGETLVYDSGHIQRGYEDLDGQLRQLGAEIEITDCNP